MADQRNPGFSGNSRGGSGGAVDLSSNKKLKRGSKNAENSVDLKKHLESHHLRNLA